ncbi:transporter substrate-binding domain-containing protein [Pseudarthrobacter sp. J1763]|uniref:transporter substrate-binding domain-containing protein n=1 Tax=Pseudarthrobacter sp. J1763 TaxID=3420445 RepID=UPI003D2989DB
MFSRKSKAAVVAALAAITLAASGCSATSSASAEAGSKEKFTIATSGTFRPITYSDGGKLTGFDIEVGTLIAEKLGMEPEFVEGQLSGLLPGLNSGKFDAVMSGLIMTETRKKSITFSTPYLADGAVAVVKKDNTTVTGLTKLDGLVAGVIGGSGTESDVKDIGGFKELKAYPGAPEGFADVAAGRIEVFAAGKIAAENFMKNSPVAADLKIVGDVYGMKPAGVGLPKNDTEMKPKVDKIINELIADGTIAKLNEKWFGFTVEIPKS